MLITLGMLITRIVNLKSSTGLARKKTCQSIVIEGYAQIHRTNKNNKLLNLYKTYCKGARHGIQDR